jgi:hypothetical protein
VMSPIQDKHQAVRLSVICVLEPARNRTKIMFVTTRWRLVELMRQDSAAWQFLESLVACAPQRNLHSSHTLWSDKLPCRSCISSECFAWVRRDRVDAQVFSQFLDNR